MTSSMDLRACLLATVSGLALLGCPSKEGEQKDANAGGTSGATAAPPPAAPGAQGPLSNLEAAPFMNEVWTAQGQKVPILFYTRENVRVSGQCRSATGQLQCAALQQLRGQPIEVPGRELDGRMSAGVKACMRIGMKLVPAFNPNGDEETFCQFPDGSLLSTGTLEQYGIKILP